MMEYKKLTTEDCPGCLMKIFAVFGVVISLVMWCILLVYIYKLNGDVFLLKIEQEKLIKKISTDSLPLFATEFYDDFYLDDADESSEEEKINILINDMQFGGSHTKDGAETTLFKRDVSGSESGEENGYFQSTSPPDPSESDRPLQRSPRTRLVKKSIRSFNSESPEETGSPELTLVPSMSHKKRHRERRLGSSYTLKPAIHMNGEVSPYLTPNYDNYLGNGIMHPHRHHFQNWTKDNWVGNLGMDDYFTLDNGYLRFLDSGLYYVYAQIYYVDEHDTNGFGVYKNDELILQCTTTSHTSNRVKKPNTCYTGGVIAVSNGDVLKVQNIEVNRYAIFGRGKSFFGALKLGESSEF